MQRTRKTSRNVGSERRREKTPKNRNRRRMQKRSAKCVSEALLCRTPRKKAGAKSDPREAAEAPKRWECSGQEADQGAGVASPGGRPERGRCSGTLQNPKKTARRDRKQKTKRTREGTEEKMAWETRKAVLSAARAKQGVTPPRKNTETTKPRGPKSGASAAGSTKIPTVQPQTHHSRTAAKAAFTKGGSAAGAAALNIASSLA